MYVALGQYQENYSILFPKPLAIKIALAVLARNEAVRKNPQRLYSALKDSWIQKKTWYQNHGLRQVSPGICSKIRELLGKSQKCICWSR